MSVDESKLLSSVNSILNGEGNSVEFKVNSLVSLSLMDQKMAFIINRELMKDTGSKLNWAISSEISNANLEENKGKLYSPKGREIIELITIEKTNALLDRVDLSSQEKMKKLVNIVSKSEDPAFSKYVSQGVLYGAKDLNLGKLLSDELDDANQIGYDKYKTDSIRFLNYNNNASEVSHVMFTEAIKHSSDGEYEMFNKIRDIADKITDQELMRDSVKMVKSKLKESFSSLSEKLDVLINDGKKLVNENSDNKIGKALSGFIAKLKNNEENIKEIKKVDSPKYK